MSCRVLKRGMELCMFDALVEECQGRGISRIIGTYIPTAKNQMVADHYRELGFQPLDADEAGATRWIYEIPPVYTPQNQFIIRTNSYDRATTAN
jgi:predicted enzyme involved in methoxymalonyl-ACP biosynthesis